MASAIGIPVVCEKCGHTTWSKRMHTMAEVALATGVTIATVYTWANQRTIITSLRYLGTRRVMRQYLTSERLSALLTTLFPDRDDYGTDKINETWRRRRKNLASWRNGPIKRGNGAWDSDRRA